MFRRFACLAVLVSASSVCADVPLPVDHVTLPGAGNANTWGVSARYDTNGQLYVWDGVNVLRQSVAGLFSSISPGGVGSGAADPGAINFTSDGLTIVVGNGSGGAVSSGNGRIFSIPMAGGSSNQAAVTVRDHSDIIPLPAISTLAGSTQKMLVEAGPFFSPSTVSIADLAAHTSTPVIASIPGAQASMAMDAAKRLYVCIGYDFGLGAKRGDIRRFDWPAIESAFLNNTPLQWTDGQWFNPNSTENNSGAGMFFDSRGYLFVGGNEGVTVFSPDGTGRSYNLGLGYVSLTYNPANDRFFAAPWGESTLNVYDAAAFVPEPASLMLPAMLAFGLLRRRQRAQRRAA